MRTIGHFIGGREVNGASGRFADVFEPMTGEVQAKVALASKAELRAAVENAKAAQPEWGATNPQRRARIMMKFLELAQRDYDKLADMLAREHGKTVPDAKGDIQRGLEVVEFACGIPHLMKGEYTEGAGPGIDIYSMRQPLGVVAGITPFNFPAMIPMWKFACAMFWRRQEPRHRHAGCRHGSDRRCLNWRGLWFGRRTLHGDLGGRSRRQGHRGPLDGKTDSKGREPEDRHLDRPLGGLWSAS